jgi:hypothetical protein
MAGRFPASFDKAALMNFFQFSATRLQNRLVMAGYIDYPAVG